MNLLKHNILNSLKYGVSTLVLFSMLLQPIAKVISIFSDDTVELVSLNWLEDTTDIDEKKEDKKDENSKEDEKKTEPQFLSSQKQSYVFVSIAPNYNVLEFMLDFNLDIVIPPPKHA